MDVIQKAEVKSKAGRKKKAIIFDDYGMEIKAEPSKVYSFRVLLLLRRCGTQRSVSQEWIAVSFSGRRLRKTRRS